MTDSKPKGRRRNSSAHSKNGCNTCKMRRVKCGEERPECLRCMKSGWRCDRYDRYDAAPSKRKSPVPLRPQEPTSMSTYNPSTIPNLDAEEQSYFQIYLDQTSTSLELHDTASLFWRRVVLQESHFNQCVRHGLVAIGAVAKSAHMKLRWAYFTNISDRSQERHRQFALIQYQKAIRGLREFIDGLEKGRGGRSTLICCMVLTLFDCFYGNVGFAAQHIRFGRKLLSAWTSTDSNKPPNQITGDPIDYHLIHMFVSLDIQATSFLEVDKEYTYPNTLQFYRSQSVIPEEIQTLEEVKAIRQQLLFDGYNVYLRTLQYKASPSEGIPEELFRLRDYYLSQITLWNSCLDEFCREEPFQEELHPLSRTTSLRLYTTILLIRLSYTLNAPATQYESLLDYFKYLLSFSREVIEFEALNATPPKGLDLESYTFEQRIIPALYLVATKCHQPSLRSQAIELLKSSHRREGLWDSFLSAKVAEWIIELETEGLSDARRMSNDAFMLEGKRAFGESIELDVQGRQAVIKCRQVVEYGGSMEKSVTVRW